MYSIRWRFVTVRSHLEELRASSKPSETFLCSMFVMEKVLRRVLLQLMVSAGFTSKHAQEICKSIRGVAGIKANWKYYDPRHRSLVDVIGNQTWQVIDKVFVMRNKLVHGSAHEQEKAYRLQVPQVLSALDHIVAAFEQTYGYAGWRGFQDRIQSKLHSDPKVTI